MTLRQFDTAAWIILAFIFGFSVGVATGWDWFPNPDDWGLIANITPSIFSYLALTLPLILLLAYSISRRKLFKDAR
jgi:H+/Cl- antiporter ClcA